MDDSDVVLRARLERLEQSVVVPARDNAVRSAPRRRTRRLVVAGVAALLVVGGAATATAVGRQVLEARGSVGLFSPGGTLACSGVWDMTPAQAQRYLEDRGYHVVWQVEDVAARGPIHTDVAPTSGYIIEGVADGDELTLVVDVSRDAVPANVRDC